MPEGTRKPFNTILEEIKSLGGGGGEGAGWGDRGTPGAVGSRLSHGQGPQNIEKEMAIVGGGGERIRSCK